MDTLSEDTMAGDPMTQFAGWLAQAGQQGLPEPTAMVLATTSAAGRPRARTVLLKAHGADGFTFYTNRTSRKGQDLQAHPQASAVFPWYALGRQVAPRAGREFRRAWRSGTSSERLATTPAVERSKCSSTGWQIAR